MANNRPLGVTILAVLYILGGLFLLVSGILSAGASTLILGAIGAAIGGIILVLFIIFAIISFLIAYGLWKGLKWGWWLIIIFSVIGLLLSIVSLIGSPVSGIVGIVIEAIVLYYMTRKEAKTYFGIK